MEVHHITEYIKDQFNMSRHLGYSAAKGFPAFQLGNILHCQCSRKELVTTLKCRRKRRGVGANQASQWGSFKDRLLLVQGILDSTSYPEKSQEGQSHYS